MYIYIYTCVCVRVYVFMHIKCQYTYVLSFGCFYSFGNSTGKICSSICPSHTPQAARKKQEMEEVSDSILNRIDLDRFQSSTKIEALREEVRDTVYDVTSVQVVCPSYSPVTGRGGGTGGTEPRRA